MKSTGYLDDARENRSPSIRREWIEIATCQAVRRNTMSLPPYGGSGLKCTTVATVISGNKSLPPCGGSGLKYTGRCVLSAFCRRLPPCGGSGLKCDPRQSDDGDRCLPPCGGSGLKYQIHDRAEDGNVSPSMRREWIEIAATA